MKKRLLLASIAAMAVSANTVADEYPNFEAYLGGAYYHHDDDRSFDDAVSLEGGIELPLTEILSLEAWFSSYDIDAKYSAAEFEAERINPGLLFHLDRGDVRPFISAGFSHLKHDLVGGSEHSESLLNLGLGVKKYFDSNVILRGEFLAMNSLDNEVLDVGARLAVGYAFGRSVSKPVTVQAPVIVPKKEQAKEIAKSPMENKPAEVAVLDADKDGVPDAADKCENTDIAFKVDETGCPVMLMETVSIQMDVKFPTNSSILSKDNYPEIEKVAKFMNQFDKTRVTVEGHSDDRGDDGYNKSLSQRRAASVRTALIERFGISEGRVTAIGYGEEKPVADNSTAEGRAENRRVVAVVESSIEKAVKK